MVRCFHLMARQRYSSEISRCFCLAWLFSSVHQFGWLLPFLPRRLVRPALHHHCRFRPHRQHPLNYSSNLPLSCHSRLALWSRYLQVTVIAKLEPWSSLDYPLLRKHHLKVFWSNRDAQCYTLLTDCHLRLSDCQGGCRLIIDCRLSDHHRRCYPWGGGLGKRDRSPRLHCCPSPSHPSRRT